MLINAYYFVMSVFGWYVWTRKVDENHFIPITKTTKKEQKMGGATVCSDRYLRFPWFIWAFDKFNAWTAYIDTLTTAIFFVGMWLMAKKKLENWTFLDYW